MVEGARLEIVYVSKGASRVRIPLSPPTYAKATVGRPVTQDGQNKILIEKIVGCPPKLYAKVGPFA